MQQVIIAIHLMVVVALVILVLYQKSEGGALGMGGGQGNFFTGRGQANALTRATSILGTIFFLTSIALTLIPAWEHRAAGGEDWTKAIDPADIQFRELKPGEKAPAADPSKDTIFDQLQRKQIERQQKQSAPVAGGVTPAEAPRVEAPRVEAPKVEAPKVEAPKPAEAPALRPTQEPAAGAAPVKPAEPPKAEAPAPTAEAPRPVEPQKWDVPRTEAAPPAEAPRVEAPKAPKAEAPRVEAPKPAAPPPPQWTSPTK